MATANPTPARSRSQIEADLAAARERLVGSVETLVDQVHPRRIKQRTIATAKQVANAEVENAKSLVFNARGDLRKDRLAKVGGAAAAVIALLVLVTVLLRRRRNA